MFMTWLTIIFLGGAGIFGHAAWTGWKTGIARLPISVFSIEEFERGESTHFWPLILLNAALSGVAFAITGLVAWSAFGEVSRPLGGLKSLDGCYEGEGWPHSMRPRSRPRAFRIADGVIFSSAGQAVSTVSIVENKSSMTEVAFSPGISIRTSADGLKRTYVAAGSTRAAKAYFRGSRTYISFPNQLFEFHTTYCGGLTE